VAKQATLAGDRGIDRNSFWRKAPASRVKQLTCMKILARLLDTEIRIGAIIVGPLICVETSIKHFIEVILRIGAYLTFGAFFWWSWTTGIVRYRYGHGGLNGHITLYGLAWFDYSLGIIAWILLLLSCCWLMPLFSKVLRLHLATCWALAAPFIYWAILAIGHLMRPTFRT